MTSDYSEKLLLRANEHLLKSKAFCLFSVDDRGQLNYTGNSEHLSQAETLGLIFFIKSFNFQSLPSSNKSPID